MLGLVPAPELPEKVAAHLVQVLPELLRSEVDARIDWHIEVVCDPLTGGVGDPVEILDETEKRKRQHGWDFAISITDLPIIRQGRVVVADAIVDKGIGDISLPAVGGLFMYRRARRAAVYVIQALESGLPNPAREPKERGEPQQTDTREHVSSMRRGAAHWRFLNYLAPLRKIIPHDPHMAVDARFVAVPRYYARLRLLAGMTRANQPWTIFPTFKSVVAAAFATGAYGLIFPTLWQLSDAYGPARFVALMGSAMTAMVVWLIIAHGLWEKPHTLGSRTLARLYNAATVLTLVVAVILYYGVLLLLFLIAVVLFVPSSLLQSKLGHPFALVDYVYLAWLATSVATIAGALGSGLESDETVRNATYGYRQLYRSRIAQEGTK